MIEDEKKIYNSLMKELQQEWENEQIIHSRVRLTRIGIKSSQISALVNLLIKKGILKPEFKIKKGERMKTDKYIAHDPNACEYAAFKTFDEAREWLIDSQDFSGGIPDEYSEGLAFIAKITHRTVVNVTDKKENYPCLKDPDVPAYCSSCEEKDCEETEEWQFEEVDNIAEVKLKEVD